jgi:hypothetical protein
MIPVSQAQPTIYSLENQLLHDWNVSPSEISSSPSSLAEEDHSNKNLNAESHLAYARSITIAAVVGL